MPVLPYNPTPQNHPTQKPPAPIEHKSPSVASGATGIYAEKIAKSAALQLLGDAHGQVVGDKALDGFALVFIMR